MVQLLRNEKGDWVLKFTREEREEVFDTSSNNIMTLLEKTGLQGVVDFADFAMIRATDIGWMKENLGKNQFGWDFVRANASDLGNGCGTNGLVELFNGQLVGLDGRSITSRKAIEKRVFDAIEAKRKNKEDAAEKRRQKKRLGLAVNV